MAVLAGRGGMHKFIGGKISDKLCQMLTPAAAHFFQKELLAGRDSDWLYSKPRKIPMTDAMFEVLP